MEDQEKVISESEIVFAEEVMKSWGEDSRSFGDLLCNNNFKILFCRKPPRVTPSGERILICSEGTANNIYADDEGYYDLKGIWLFKSDVEEHLKSHPYLSFPIDADAIVDSGGSGSTYDIFDDLISFYAVKSKIQIGPSQFVDAVKDHNTPVYYKTTNGFEGTSLGQYDNLRFCVGDLNNAWFHENDVKHLYLQTKDNFQEKKIDFSLALKKQKDDVIADIRMESEALKGRISELENSNSSYRDWNKKLHETNTLVARKNAEIKILADQAAQEADSLKQSLADLEATNQDLQSSLDAALGGRERWRPSCLALFEAMKQVMENGRDDWTQAEFLNVAREIYKASGAYQCPLDEAERLVWSALPKQFKAGPGNPRHKGNSTKP